MKVLDNPFYILKCMPESSRSTIHEQAEEKSFDIDENLCKEAENILINPKKRLEAEISWFPGFGIKTVTERVKAVFSDTRKYVSDLFFLKTKNYLAEANLLAFGLELAKDVSEWSKDDIRLAASFLCTFCEKINVSESIKKIAASREKSKFPSNILEEDALQYIDEQKHYYENTLYDFFQKIDSDIIVDILTKMANESTDNGRIPSKWYLFENIIGKYEADLKDFLEEERALILNKLDIITDIIVSKKGNNLEEALHKLETDLIYWKDKIYPIMLIKMSRGLNDENSENIYYPIRKLIIISSNNDNHHFALRLTKICKNIFAELRSVRETIEKDDRLLSSLAQKADDEARETKELMEFSYEWGTIKKNSVKTTVKSITIDGKETFIFEDIEKIKWNKKVDNSILEKVSMYIQFVVKNRKIPVLINIDSELVYERLRNILWRAVGTRFLNKYIKELSLGRKITIGPITFYDYGIELVDKGFIFSTTQMFTWKDIEYVKMENGIFEVKGPDNYKLSVSADCEYNIYAVYALISAFFDNGNGIRISSLKE